MFEDVERMSSELLRRQQEQERQRILAREALATEKAQELALIPEILHEGKLVAEFLQHKNVTTIPIWAKISDQSSVPTDSFTVQRFDERGNPHEERVELLGHGWIVHQVESYTDGVCYSTSRTGLTVDGEPMTNLSLGRLGSRDGAVVSSYGRLESNVKFLHRTFDGPDFRAGMAHLVAGLPGVATRKTNS